MFEGLEYLAGSLAMLALWLALYFARTRHRREMMWASAVTAPLAFLEPLFVPEYWNPPGIFALAQSTGFDIESFIFCFAVGGISAVIYEIVFPARHVAMKKSAMKSHRYHHIAIAAGPLAFAILYFATSLNIIYISIIAMALAGLAGMLCRPDISRKILFSGALFFAFYFLFFIFFNAAFPGYVEKVWNLGALSGVLVAGIPLEELLYAIAQGMMWGSLYEHLFWFRLAK